MSVRAYIFSLILIPTVAMNNGPRKNTTKLFIAVSSQEIFLLADYASPLRINNISYFSDFYFHFKNVQKIRLTNKFEC